MESKESMKGKQKASWTRKVAKINLASLTFTHLLPALILFKYSGDVFPDSLYLWPAILAGLWQKKIVKAVK